MTVNVTANSTADLTTTLSNDVAAIPMPNAERHGSTRPHCHPPCSFQGSLRDHHDQLLAVEESPEAVLDLMELALTWGELDYSHARVIPPAQWWAFIDSHEWRDPDRVRRTFALAWDIALRSEADALPVPARVSSSRRQPARV